MEQIIFEETFTKDIIESIKNDDVESLKKIINDNPDAKKIKIGNLPLISVATLFSAFSCFEFLTDFFGEVNAYSETDAPFELTEKLQKLLDDCHFRNENAETSDLESLYSGARFIEPCEIALLSGNVDYANEIMDKTGIKTLSARKRIENLVKKNENYTFSVKGEKYRIIDSRNKTKKYAFTKRRKILLFAIALFIAIVVPIIVLASMQVKVTYYVDENIYGIERGIGGAKITVDVPEKEGHTFIGWFLDQDLKNFSNNKLPKKNGNLYAGWKENEYTITFECDCLPEGFSKTNVGKYGKVLNFPIPETSGKFFLGWFDDEDRLCKSNVFTQDLVLTAKFVDFSNNSIENPYEITKQDEFLYLSSQKGFFSVKDGLVIDETFLSSGILCDISKGFKGVLDGQNRTLIFKGVTPLFVNISENGIVKNLNISVEKDITISSNRFDRFGTLAVINSGTIDKVSVNFETDSKKTNFSSSSSLSFLGGLVGSNSGEIKSCSVGGDYSSSIGLPFVGTAYIGGLAGANVGTIENSVFSANCIVQVANRGFGAIAGYNSGELKECMNTGKIEANGILTANDLSNYISQVGGIVAVNVTSSSETGKISVGRALNCVNEGEIIISNHNLELYVGGIASDNEGVLDSCDNKGKVSILNGNDIRFTGGVVGLSLNRGYGEITNCKNYANVEETNGGYSYLGGIAGYTGAMNSQNEAVDDLILNLVGCENYGNLTDGGQMGGIVGYAFRTALSECINEGDISVKTVVDERNARVLGGLIGGTSECRVQYCQNKGKISHTNFENKKITAYAGGLIADCIDTKIENSTSTSTVSYSGNDVAGLICAVINSIDSAYSEIINTTAISDGKTPSFYAYNSAIDEKGGYIDHEEGNPSKPVLYPDFRYLLEG